MYDIQRHTKAHKEQFCSLCEKMFPSKTKLEAHKRKFHLQKCELCNCKIKIGKTEWESQKNMQNHYDSKHKKN